MSSVKDILEELQALVEEHPETAEMELYAMGTYSRLNIFRDGFKGEISGVSLEDFRVMNRHETFARELFQEMGINSRRYSPKHLEYLTQLSLEDRSEEQMKEFIDKELIHPEPFTDFTGTADTSIEFNEDNIAILDFQYDKDCAHFSSYMVAIFDVDKKFGLDCENDDSWVKPTAVYNYLNDELKLECRVERHSGMSKLFIYIPTENEKSVILNLIDKYCLKEKNKSMKEICSEVLEQELSADNKKTIDSLIFDAKHKKANQQNREDRNLHEKADLDL